LVAKTLKHKGARLLGQSSLPALSLKLGGAGGNFLLAVLIPKLIGVDVAAAFYIFNYAALILSILVRLGMDNVILRQIASEGESITLSTLKRAFSNAFLCSLLCLAIGFAAAYVAPFFTVQDVVIVVTISLWWSLTQLVCVVFKGLGQNAYAAFFDAIPVVLPLILAVLMGVDETLTLIILQGVLATIALAFALIIIVRLCRGVAPVKNKEHIQSYDHMFVDALNFTMLWLPFFVVAMVWGDQAASNINIIVKLVMVGNLFIAVFNGITAKKVSKLLSDSRMVDALKAARCQTLFALAWVFPLTFSTLAAGYLLNFFAGIESHELIYAMAILLFSQLINMLTGPVDIILAMARKSRTLLAITAISFCISSLALFVFVWQSYLIGTALSILAGVAAFNLISANKVSKELGGYVFPRFYSSI